MPDGENVKRAVSPSQVASTVRFISAAVAELAQVQYRPSGVCLFCSLPAAYAVGYILAPLRG